MDKQIKFVFHRNNDKTATHHIIWLYDYKRINHVISDECCNIIYFPHHTFHLPGAAGTIPHKPWIIYFFVCHLGLVTVLVVQIMALLALDQLVSHCHCHLSEEHKQQVNVWTWKRMLDWHASLIKMYLQTTQARPISMAKSSALVSS